MCSKLCAVITFIFLLHNVNSLNILGIFEIPSKSQHILGHQLLLGLAKRGHNVTLMTAFPFEERRANYSHVYLEGLVEFKEKHYRPMIQGQSKFGIFSMINAQINFVELAMSGKNLQQFLKSDNKYDIIIQTYVLNEGYLGLADHFDARVIGFIPFSGAPHINALTGNSAPYSYVSIPFLGFTQDMSFLQRTVNTLAGTFLTLLQTYYLFPKQEEILKKYFPNAPSLSQIQNDRVDLVFVNAHFSTESPRPKTPNLVYIGGYHVQEPEPLPTELKKYLDDSYQGVVFSGLGSNVEASKLPKETLDAFINTFAKSPHNILFKYDGILLKHPKNVKTATWFPQRGILAHPNTKVFISHGGHGSITENLYFGVPTLCISFYGDQKKNCEDIMEYGCGIHLPHQEVTEETFGKALNELVKNPKYLENAKYRATLFKEQEMDPFDRINFWVEHVHKYKGVKHLRPQSITMPLYQYLLLDVWAFILFIFALTLFLFYKCMMFVLKLVLKKIRNVRKDKLKKH